MDRYGVRPESRAGQGCCFIQLTGLGGALRPTCSLCLLPLDKITRMEMQQQSSLGPGRSPNSSFVPTTAAPKETMQTLRIHYLRTKIAGYMGDGLVGLCEFLLLYMIPFKQALRPCVRACTEDSNRSDNVGGLQWVVFNSTQLLEKRSR